jgi:hypothetical protein
MQRAHRGADAAAAAAAATVAPLLQLKRAAQKADSLWRVARAVELYERALAAAELAQPRDSLVIAALLSELLRAQSPAPQASPSSPAAAERVVDLKQRSLHLLHARWQAGTLFSPTAEETAYLWRTSIRVCLRRCVARSSTSASPWMMQYNCRSKFFRHTHLLPRRRLTYKDCMVRCVRRLSWMRAVCWSVTRARGKRGQPTP